MFIVCIESTVCFFIFITISSNLYYFYKSCLNEKWRQNTIYLIFVLYLISVMFYIYSNALSIIISNYYYNDNRKERNNVWFQMIKSIAFFRRGKLFGCSCLLPLLAHYFLNHVKFGVFVQHLVNVYLNPRRISGTFIRKETSIMNETF